MVRVLQASLLLVLSLPSLLRAAELTLTSPVEYQVTQRQTRTEGRVRIRGKIDGADVAGLEIEARVTQDAKPGSWQKLTARFEGRGFDAAMTLQAGGWYQLEVRASKSGAVLAEAKVDHLGIGEVFVVAGQSNSANHGESKQTTRTGRVASFDSQHWQLANDPQRGASGNGGSFMPPLGDELVKRFDVPVGFIPCGIGATSVREWLPKDATFPNPPTIESRVERLSGGEWASNGDAYGRFLARMKLMGPNGFRAVLWHQGESDAHQQDPTRTLSGKLYREYLERTILSSRSEIGWDAPWFVAQVSYHVPGDEASPEIREAQASLWKDGVAFAGPDSDALKGDLRERNGQGVHFSDKGLKVHAAKWAGKIAPWLDGELAKSAPAAAGVSGDLEFTETLALPECHSTEWVRANARPPAVKTWDWPLDEAQWRAAVQQKGEGKKEDCTFDLWLPAGIEVVKGIVVISAHGSGPTLYKHPELRKFAREQHLAIFKFIGNPVQRGFWPKSLLYERLRAFGQRVNHPELEYAPLFLYGHSNGTGFSAIFPATESARVWAWVSMRPGTTPQVAQPGAAQVPGLVIFGEVDPVFAKPSQRENLAVVEGMRRDHGALWNFAVEPKTGHGPGDKTWPLVLSFLRETWAARVPADSDPRKGPVALKPLSYDTGYLGQTWDVEKGGYQLLPIAPIAKFAGEKATASWLINERYATDWQEFQAKGELSRSSSH